MTRSRRLLGPGHMQQQQQQMHTCTNMCHLPIPTINCLAKGGKLWNRLCMPHTDLQGPKDGTLQGQHRSRELSCSWRLTASLPASCPAKGPCSDRYRQLQEGLVSKCGTFCTSKLQPSKAQQWTCPRASHCLLHPSSLLFTHQCQLEP
jgi:hypothetical protein